MSKKETFVKPSGNAGTFRILAVLLWILGLACEVVGILTLLGKIEPFFDYVTFIIVALVLDAVFVLIGSYLWRRANRIDPPSEKNKVEFFIKMQLGAIVSVIAFLPILIFLLSDKKLDKKAKTWVSILAAVLLLLVTGLSADWNPISLEDLEQMQVNAEESDFGSGNVKWSVNSKVYHTWEECGALHRIFDNNLREGTVKDAFEAGKARMCKYCAAHFNIVDGVEDGGLPATTD